MSKRLLFILLTGLLLLLAASSSSKPAGSFEALFCPQCWDYLWGAGSVDLKGNCAACGKYPVALEGQTAMWWWCSSQERWLEAPCDQSAVRHCCAGEESIALVSPGADVFWAWYCPVHRTFDGVTLPVLGIPICGTCARPAVKVQATRRAWYWCESEGVWNPSACPLDPVRKCCAKHQGILLVSPQPRPWATSEK
ncbi:MAG TPA: hypothetical protein VKU80_11140 [Planctomycetota bacterium]|nr:hypothetical protein [Planctomycetota bacterium]